MEAEEGGKKLTESTGRAQQVPDTADVMEAEESGKKRSRQGADGSGVKMWLDRPAPTPTQPDTTPSSNKENTPAGRSSDKRRRLSATLEETSASASTKLATRLFPSSLPSSLLSSLPSPLLVSPASSSLLHTVGAACLLWLTPAVVWPCFFGSGKTSAWRA